MKKTVLITGASGSIGVFIADKFARNGYNIVFQFNKNENKPAVLALSKVTNVLPVRADLTNPREVQALVETAVKTFGKIDCLVNNAGISTVKLSLDESFESIHNLINTNLISAIYLTSLTIPHLNRNASVINISSIWGEYGGSLETTYSASKAGLIGYTKALAKELGHAGIRVNAVAPGLIESKMNNHITSTDRKEFVEDHTALGRIGTPEDVANCVYFLASDQAAYITGQTVGVNGGFV